MRKRITLLVFLLTVCWLVPMLAVWGITSRVSTDGMRERLNASAEESVNYAAESASRYLASLIALSRRVSADGNLEKIYAGEINNLGSDNVYLQTRRAIRNALGSETYAGPIFLRYKGSEEQPVYVTSRADNSRNGRVTDFFNKDFEKILAAESGEDAYIRFFCFEGRFYIARNLLTASGLEPFALLILRADVAPLEEMYAHLGFDAELSLTVSDYSGAGSAELCVAEGSSSGTSFTQEIRTGDYILYATVVTDLAESRPEISEVRNAGFIMILAMAPLLMFMLLLVVIQISNLYGKLYRGELGLRDAKIEQLQAQINPHFLGNTLELINWEARRINNESISRMAENLGILTKAALNRDKEPTVKLDDEMEFAYAYLSIVEQRFADRITLNVRVDEDLLEREVPRLSIQPLLENAVAHGVKDADAAELSLEIYTRGDEMVIAVTNTGEMKDEDRRHADAILAGEENRSIGLSNVNARIKLLYGNKADLTYVSADGKTTFEIAIRL